MCGICGQYNYGDRAPVDLDRLMAMTRSMVHRGPDDEGVHLAGEIGLGFRRLSIIDLDGGRQPMSDGAEQVWVVFNGEIYNFRTLRRVLESRGHVFRTRSDTEVIVHGYNEWGPDVLSRLNGMFGLAIWDERRRQLLLARDAMGIKPLYYCVKKGVLWFGSEIRALLATGEIRPEVDPDAMALFLRYRYTPAPWTIFKGVLKLPAGSLLIADSNGLRMERWYNVKPEPFDPMPSVQEAETALADLYSQAIERQIVADVPVGLLLSGGVDSGLLLGLMSRLADGWKTYTVGYGASFRFDEISEAEETARNFGSDHCSVLLDREVFENTLSRAVSILEEPVASSSVVPMYHVSQRARKDVKVVLMGQGPDELFGGYQRHLGVRYGHFWRLLPDALRLSLCRVLSTLPRSETTKRGLYSLHLPDRAERYKEVFAIVPGRLIRDLFRQGVLSDGCDDKLLECWSDLFPLLEKTDELGGFQFLEMRSSLPDELLMYGDKLSMAHGLEVRVPFLDTEIVQYAERLSAAFKVRRGSRKWLHRRVCRRFLPKRVVARPKRGFAVKVVDDWYRDSTEGKMACYLLDPESSIYRYIRFEVVERLIRDHRTQRSDNHKILFSLVMLEEWFRQYATGSDSQIRWGRESVRGPCTVARGVVI